jgi:hypothetical protein
MKFIKKTLEYLFVLEKGRRFLLLFVLSTPIGAAAAFLTPTRYYTEWILNFTVGDANFWHVFTFGRGGVAFPVTLAIFLAAAVIFVSAQATIVARSMRVGVFKAGKLFGELNESFYPSFFAVLIYTAAFIVFKTVSTLLLVLWQYLDYQAVAAVLSLLSLIIVYLSTVVFVSIASLVLPIMGITGLRPGPALESSVRKCSRHLKALALGIGLPIVVLTTAGALVGLTGNVLLSELADTFLYSFMFSYLTVLAYVAYHEIEEIKREDYPREYFYKGK